MRQFPVRPALTILTFGALLVIAGLVRGGSVGLNPALFAAVLDFRPSRPLPDLTAAPVVQPRAVSRMAFFLDDPPGALDHFYEALWRTERQEPGAVTRILHYGDSPTTADLISADVRSLLQQRFGNAGHGFTLPAKPWAWYEHRGVQLSGSGWSIHPATHPDLKDRMFGLGGVAFVGSGEASSRIVLKDTGHTLLGVSYLQQPSGGRIILAGGGATLGEIETEAATLGPGFASFDLRPPVADIELRAEGQVRLFGVTLEKAGPGVVYDSLGVNGAFTTILARIFNEGQWAGQLRWRRPDLVILNYGANESGFAAYVDKEYEKELRQALRRLRAALPRCSLLIMSPMDRAERASGGEIQTLASIPRLVAIQRRVARETGCGFFDTFAAMGGDGTAARWYEAQPRLISADFIHVTPAGGRKVGEQLYRALSAGLNDYKSRHIDGGQILAKGTK
jgi:lysophospholipase L1-like esterase